MVFIFIRFFIFADPPSDQRDYQSHIRQQRQAKLLPETDASPSVILEKTYYDVNEHSPESLDWFTVLVAQAIGHIRDHASQGDHLLNALSTLLNSDKIPSFVGPIKVSTLDIGKELPIFSNCRIVSVQSQQDDTEHQPPHTPSQSPDMTPTDTFNSPRSSDARPHTFGKHYSKKEKKDEILEAHLDVDLSDHITLGIDTRLVINFPRKDFAFLPVFISVSIVNFSGTLKISLRNPPQTPNNEQANNVSGSENPDHGVERGSEQETEKNPGGAYVTFSFSPNYRLEFKVNSSIGSRSKVQDSMKVAQLVETRLRRVFESRFVYPNAQKVYLPSLFSNPRPRDLQPGTSSIPGNATNGDALSGATASETGSSIPVSSNSAGGPIPLSHQAMKDFDHHLSHASQYAQQLLHPRSFSTASQLASNTAINLRPQLDLSQDSQEFPAVF